MILKRPLLFALVLGIATSFLIGVAAIRLPYSEARDAVTDALTLPGGLIARLVYPAGVHTGRGAPNWGLVAWGANVAVYILFWYVLQRLARYFRSPSQGRKDYDALTFTHDTPITVLRSILGTNSPARNATKPASCHFLRHAWRRHL
jgi:hypothetical protein